MRVPARVAWLTVASVLACSRAEPAGVLLVLKLAGGTPRPQYAELTWSAADGRSLANLRRPPAGEFRADRSELDTVFIERGANPSAERKALVRGMREGRQVCVGAARVLLAPGGTQRVEILLRESLPDSDRDGTPDEIDDDCLAPGSCAVADGGAPDAAGPDADLRDVAWTPDAGRAPDAPIEGPPTGVEAGPERQPTDLRPPDEPQRPEASSPDTGEWRTIDFRDFSNVSALQLNGNSVVRNAVVVLAATAADQKGSLFVRDPIPLGPVTDLEVSFTFRIAPGSSFTPADGVVFVLQNAAAGPAALGGAGWAMGYHGIKPSLAVEFDIFKNPWDPDGDHVSVLRDGDSYTPVAPAVAPSFNLKDGAPTYVWVEVRARIGEMRVYVARSPARPALPLVRHAVDVSSALGGRAYVGFTASTGGENAIHEIHALRISYGPSRP